MEKPEWLTIKPASTEKYAGIKRTISVMGLHTVCAEAHCPNTAECWSSGTATFLVLGDTCTRGCRFCSVPKNANGASVDALEPEKLANAVKEWGLSYVVITSVCRDDLPDQGAGHFAACIKEIKRTSPKTAVEVLIPDFRGDEGCLRSIVDAQPDVIGHNVETVESLSPKLRDRRASYSLSLGVLAKTKELAPSIYTKSALMVGIGESEPEVVQTMKDLRGVHVDFLAIGQYLRPGQRNAEVIEYVHPETFDKYKDIAEKLGFMYVASGPFVRSSYKSGEYFTKAIPESKRPSA